MMNGNESITKSCPVSIKPFKSTIGAVGNDSLPFGIEYRSSLRMSEINTGYLSNYGNSTVQFGPDMLASDSGFEVCKYCGIVALPDDPKKSVLHRRSCQSRKKHEKLKQEGKQGDPFEWDNIYLYRSLRSEAIRLLLPFVDDRDIATLNACIYLGLRLRFEGDPGHLVILPQSFCDAATHLTNFFLILMDTIPGGTGYLKVLFQEKDSSGREGEGIIDVLRRARDTMETCSCRKLNDKEDQEDTDGCYRCIRSYHSQYDSDKISRERGIQLLNQLIEAGEKRVQKKSLSDISHDSLFESVLEKKLVDSLKSFVQEKNGNWQETIIKGSLGFRFSLIESGILWELELQPSLGVKDGVMIQSKPDFLLRADDDTIKPIAIFTDGFDFHCHPKNRLEDDIQKRRAIIDSGNFWVWNVTWDDLTKENESALMVCHSSFLQYLEKYANASRSNGMKVPVAQQVTKNGFIQLKEFILNPSSEGWSQLALALAYFPLGYLREKNRVELTELKPSLDLWCRGSGMKSLNPSSEGQWIYNDRASLNQDVITYISVQNEATNKKESTTILARLGDSESEVTGSDFKERWRRFLSCLNLYQFTNQLIFWTVHEALVDENPYIPFKEQGTISEEWNKIIQNVTISIRAYLLEIASSNIPYPEVEYFNDDVAEEAFAEIAWPNLKVPVCILIGDQAYFVSKWQEIGWITVILDDLQSKGVSWLVDLIGKNKEGV